MGDLRVRVYANADAAARALAREIARALAEKPRLVLGLPSGRTPIPLYRELVRLHRVDRADFSRATTFNLDEFLGLGRSDSSGFHGFMRQHLFDHVNLSPRRAHVLDGEAADPDAECVRFDRAIARAGGIDLQILGLGLNGHIGFNEPGRSLVAATHRVRLTTMTRRASVDLFGSLHDVPREALSMGMATILRARRIVLLATGASKAEAVARTLSGLVTTRVPASFLQLHPNAEIWLDRPAASQVGTA